MALLAGHDFLVTAGAEFVLAGEVAMFGADGKDRSDGDIGQPVTGQSAANKAFTDFGTGEGFAHIEV